MDFEALLLVIVAYTTFSALSNRLAPVSMDLRRYLLLFAAYAVLDLSVGGFFASATPRLIFGMASIPVIKAWVGKPVTKPVTKRV